MLGGGIAGALAGYGLEYWTQVIAFPLNIGGRPFHSWVSFIPPAFETTILFAAFSAVISMIVLNGLPQPYHPVFNAKRFHLASQDKFFLAIEASRPEVRRERHAAFLSGLNARQRWWTLRTNTPGRGQKSEGQKAEVRNELTMVNHSLEKDRRAAPHQTFDLLPSYF